MNATESTLPADVIAAATDEGQAALAASAALAAEARRAAKAEVARVARAAAKEREAAAAAARQPGPVTIVQAPATKPSRAARKAGIAPTVGEELAAIADAALAKQEKVAKPAEPRKPVRALVIVEIEVDRDAWDREYGEESTSNEIRASLVNDVGGYVTEAFKHIDAVTVKLTRTSH